MPNQCRFLPVNCSHVRIESHVRLAGRQAVSYMHHRSCQWEPIKYDVNAVIQLISGVKACGLDKYVKQHRIRVRKGYNPELPVRQTTCVQVIPEHFIRGRSLLQCLLIYPFRRKHTVIGAVKRKQQRMLQWSHLKHGAGWTSALKTGEPPTRKTAYGDALDTTGTRDAGPVSRRRREPSLARPARARWRRRPIRQLNVFCLHTTMKTSCFYVEREIGNLLDVDRERLHFGAQCVSLRLERLIFHAQTSTVVGGWKSIHTRIIITSGGPAPPQPHKQENGTGPSQNSQKYHFWTTVFNITAKHKQHSTKQILSMKISQKYKSIKKCIFWNFHQEGSNKSICTNKP